METLRVGQDTFDGNYLFSRKINDQHVSFIQASLSVINTLQSMTDNNKITTFQMFSMSIMFFIEHSVDHHSK